MKLRQSILDDFDSLNLRQGKYLLAFSAGPDSVYLLWMLKEYFQEELSDHIALVYINYHDSPFVDQEESIVYYYRDLFHLQLIQDDTKFNDVGNFEEWARNYRYDLFNRLCKEHCFTALLTAHQKTDVVETYLLQKERGNLPTFYGLRKTNDLYGLPLYRPLLSISKRELTKELDENHLPYYDDITNKNLKKKRNKIRTELTEESVLNQYLAELQTRNQTIESWNEIFSAHPFSMEYNLYQSLSEEAQKRYCFFLLDQIHPDKREGIGKRLFDFLKNPTIGQFKLNQDYLIYRNKDFFFLSKDLSKIQYSYHFEENKKYTTPYFDIDLTDPKQFNLPDLPVTIRNYHPGDLIQTDLPNKDIKRFLQKQGVPAYLLPLYPIFLYQDKIQCVPFYKDILNQKIPLKLSFFKGIHD